MFEDLLQTSLAADSSEGQGSIAEMFDLSVADYKFETVLQPVTVSSPQFPSCGVKPGPDC